MSKIVFDLRNRVQNFRENLKRIDEVIANGVTRSHAARGYALALLNMTESERL